MKNAMRFGLLAMVIATSAALTSWNEEENTNVENAAVTESIDTVKTTGIETPPPTETAKEGSKTE